MNSYTENMLSKNICLIDTSSLMNVAMPLFVSKYKEFLKSNHIKIAIHVLNWEELRKHIESGNREEMESADRALRLIQANPEIFEYVGHSYDHNRIRSTFADPMILSELLINKPHFKQLLISNDEDLNSDAYGFLNSLNSVSGNKIFVCHIGKEGDLVKSHCVSAINDNQNFTPKQIIIERPVEKIVEKTIEKTVYVNKKSISNLQSFAAGSSCTAICFYIYKNKEEILKTAKNLYKKLASAI